ncbi:Uncharacterised protein [Enterobacter hormaechei]|nr:Uncharacterised protein [Enterobacter hormaechei]
MKLLKKHRVKTASLSTTGEDDNYPSLSILVSPSAIDS